MRRPRLVDGVRLVEQRMRDEPSFVARSPSTGTYARFRAHEARVVALLDGERTVAQIASVLAAEGLPVSATVVEGFVNRLASLGFVERSLAERSSAQMERLRHERKGRRKRPLFRGELLRMRFSVGDPDAMLTRTLPLVRWCFTPRFVVASAILFAMYLLFMVAYWHEVTGSFTALVSPANLTLLTGALFWITFVVIGAVHELGHAYACKHFSGDVREMGVMVLYFQPAFYCNVNDAWSFPVLRHRMWVTVAGGWIELWLAAIGAGVWLLVAPGTVASDVALLVTVMAGGLTLLSNANPLLPYDGYFALSDWLEIPNLRQRARSYFAWWLDHHVLRRVREEPVVTPRERRIFLWYSVLATLYIAMVYWVLLTIVAGWVWRTFGTGVSVALAALLMLRARERIRSGYFQVRRAATEAHRGYLRPWIARWSPRWMTGGIARLPVRWRGWRLAAVAALLALRGRERIRTGYFQAQRAVRETHRGYLRPWVARWTPRWIAGGLARLPARWRGWRLATIAALVGLLLPWPRTVSGRWTALPMHHAVVTTPTAGTISEVLVATGEAVQAGTPVLRVQEWALARQEPEQRLTRDSLATLAGQAWAQGTQDGASLDAGVARASAVLASTTTSGRGRLVRATSDGTVLTAQAERWAGRAVVAGTPVLHIGSLDSLDVLVRLDGGGAAEVRAGMPVSLMLDADGVRTARATLLRVGVVTAHASPGSVEAVVRLPADSRWQVGTEGRAIVRLGRSTVGDALLWAVRTRLRTELLL